MKRTIKITKHISGSYEVVVVEGTNILHSNLVDTAEVPEVVAFYLSEYFI